MTEQEIARLRALIENATPLPWEVVFEPGKHIVIGSRTEHTGVCVIFNDVHDLEYKQDNAALIVSAVNALPALLDAAERLEVAEKYLANAIQKAAENSLQSMTAKPCYGGGTCRNADLVEELNQRIAELEALVEKGNYAIGENCELRKRIFEIENLLKGCGFEIIWSSEDDERPRVKRKDVLYYPERESE